MSAQDITAELPKLSRAELEQVDARLHDLLREAGGTSEKSWGAALLEVAGTAQGLPPDYAHNHDHYLHGAPAWCAAKMNSVFADTVYFLALLNPADQLRHQARKQ